MLTYYLGKIEFVLESLEFETNIGLFCNLGNKQDDIRYSSRHKETCCNLPRTLEEKDSQKWGYCQGRACGKKKKKKFYIAAKTLSLKLLYFVNWDLPYGMYNNCYVFHIFSFIVCINKGSGMDNFGNTSCCLPFCLSIMSVAKRDTLKMK